jgi:DNA-binding XRE family transcriptional regulator
MWFRIRNKESLQQALMGVRAHAHFTQAELAERLHVDRSTVIRMENDTSKNMERLIEAFSIAGFDLIAVPRQSDVTISPLTDDAPRLVTKTPR